MKKLLLIFILLSSLYPSLIFKNSFSLDVSKPEIIFEVDSNNYEKSLKILEVIIFANNLKELENLKLNNDLIRSYNQLQAVRMTIDESEIADFVRLYGKNIFPASLLDRVYQLDNIEIQEIELSNKEIIDFTSIDSLWNLGYNGTGVVAVVFDNGVDFTHSALSGKELATFSVATPGTQPCKSHGTLVAGMLVANNNTNQPNVIGTGFGAKLIDISLGCLNGGEAISGDFLAGFEYILENNETIDVVNTSFGGFAPPWDFITEKIESAGVVLVGSAGNDGPYDHTTTTGGPGNSIHSISVGSVNNQRSLATFSARGPVYDMLYKPDILAPGVSLVSTTKGGGYATVLGTSFSSPIVAGAIASLISGLNDMNIDWNPGVIKSAILRSAESISENELATGQGILNIKAAWDLIQNSNLDGNNIPEIVMMTPSSGPIHYLEDIPQGMKIELPLTLISSNPESTTISFSGDLNGVSTYSQLRKTYSQKIIIEIDTGSMSPNQLIEGNVTAKLGSDTFSTQLKINIGDPFVAKVGVDLGHTYWDQTGSDNIGGGNIGEMIKLAMQMGFWVEEINSEFNNAVVSNYDIIWMPDPINLIDSNDQTLRQMGFFENSLRMTEIDVLVNFVKNGGNLIIDSNGFRNDSINSKEELYGLNATGINKLTTNFGIIFNEVPILEPESQSAAKIINQTSLAKSVNIITHWGNYLTVESNAWALAQDDNGRISTAYYVDPDSGGRVVVSSTNYWLDNFGIKGLYTNAGLENKQLAENLWRFLINSAKVIKISDASTENNLSGDFKLLINGSSTSIVPNLILEQNEFVIGKTLDPVNNGDGTFSFEYQLPGIGIYRIISSYGTDYIAWEAIVDNQGPAIQTSGQTKNKMIFTSGSNYLFTFEIVDDISGINQDTIKVLVNNKKISPTKIFNEAIDTLTIIIDDEILASFGTDDFILALEITDRNENLSKFILEFSINRGSKNPGSDTTNGSTTGPSSEKKGNLEFGILWLYLPIAMLVLLLKISRKIR